MIEDHTTTANTVNQNHKKKSLLRRLKSGTKYQLQIVKSHPRIGYVTVLIFVLLCGIGLGIVFAIRNNHIEILKEQSLELAQEKGDFFSTQLDQALFPLFSIAQFGTELDFFHELNPLIGVSGQPNSAPYIGPVHRNVSGICDDPTLLERYDKIAQTIKSNANMPGVLVNIELVPQGVVCLAYPMINTEDFPPNSGIALDSTRAIGLDLATLPADKGFMKRAMQLRQQQEEQVQQGQQGQHSQVTIQGPLFLEQCNADTNGGENCYPAVEQAFIARMAVRVPGITTTIDDTTYDDTWGLAAVLLNWDELVLRSGMYETFDQLGLGFQLTKTDMIDDIEEVIILAETNQFQTQIASKPSQIRTVTVALDTTDNEWEMTIAYPVEEQWLFYMIGVVVVLSFLVALLIQTLLVQQRQYKTMEKKYLDDVAQPQKLRLKMFLDDETTQHMRSSTAESSTHSYFGMGNNNSNSRRNQQEEEKILTTKPIADMYPHTTVMFADISGFTAWSSERTPALIFTLLQNIFFAFDRLAEKHNVFRVDTVGDSYVAACGFPNPQDDHAVRMAKFARACMDKVPEITKMLVQRLGPDTGDLRMRFGLHSGPVTAGVLAGDKKARVQLLGETINTAAKIESLGKQNRIHLTEATAALLRDAGKGKWIALRADKVHAKGLGLIQTYWLMADHRRKRSLVENDKNSNETLSLGDDSRSLTQHSNNDGASSTGGESCLELWGDEDATVDDLGDGIVDAKTGRLVEWHVEFLLGLIKQIVARRGPPKTRRQKMYKAPSTYKRPTTTVLEEVKEVISLPQFNAQDLQNVVDIDSISISEEVSHQLRDYVSEIALLYRNNCFHNFEHASHVTMAVHKLLNRIVTPEDVNYQHKNASKIASELHNYTFGITSDPLTHFAIVMSALIHDVDHTGVSNGQLAQEDPVLAERYKSQSIAEQNSVDLAWNILMEPKYGALHACIFSDQTELLRFRQIIVNSVLATDIFDKELKALRNLRWDKAFHPDQVPAASLLEGSSTTGSSNSTSVTDTTSSLRSSTDGSNSDGSPTMRWTDTNRKATIVIEHIIQASDVAHTMQHWHVYTKWNEKLFQEMYVGWKNGRSPKNPAEGWYKGELWFFDNYIIPLAQKLAECGVFGASSDESLHNALQNRSEWEARGESLLEEMVENAKKVHG